MIRNMIQKLFGKKQQQVVKEEPVNPDIWFIEESWLEQVKDGDDYIMLFLDKRSVQVLHVMDDSLQDKVMALEAQALLARSTNLPAFVAIGPLFRIQYDHIAVWSKGEQIR